MTQDIEEKWMEVYRVQTAAIERLEQQNAELLAALIYHQEQTRPIQQSIDAIAKAGA